MRTGTTTHFTHPHSALYVTGFANLLSLFLVLGSLASVGVCQARYTSSFQTLPRVAPPEGAPADLSDLPKPTERMIFSELPAGPRAEPPESSDDLPPVPPAVPFSSSAAAVIPDKRTIQPLTPSELGATGKTEPLPILPATPDEAFFTRPERSPITEDSRAFDNFRVRHDSIRLTSPAAEQPLDPNVALIHFEAGPDPAAESAFPSFAEPAKPSPTESSFPPVAESSFPPAEPLAESASEPASEPAATFPNSGRTSADLIDRYSLGSATSQTWGTPTQLVDLLRLNIAAGRKAEMVNQYWETWMRWGRMQNCLRHREWLERIGRTSNPYEQLLLDSARNLADSQTTAAEIDFKRAQIRLLQFLNPGSGNLPDYQKLPLPADLPLVEKYQTNFDLYRQRGRVPNRLFHINSVLSDTYDLIDGQTAGVNLTQSTTEQLIPAFRQGQLSLANLLEAGRNWKTAEENLITSVANYNRMIADYSLTVANPNHSPEVLAAMLIGEPQNRPDKSESAGISTNTSPTLLPSDPSLTTQSSPRSGLPTGLPSSSQPPQAGLSSTDPNSSSPVFSEAGNSRGVNTGESNSEGAFSKSPGFTTSNSSNSRPASQPAGFPPQDRDGGASADWRSKPENSAAVGDRPSSAAASVPSHPKSDTVPPWGPRTDSPGRDRGSRESSFTNLGPNRAEMPPSESKPTELNPVDHKPVDSGPETAQGSDWGGVENRRATVNSPPNSGFRPLPTEPEVPFRPIFPPDQND
jgi:hypothetical protein